MAISRDASIGSGSVNPGTTLTFTHTTTSGTDKVLWVFLFHDNDTITGVTYNSVAMSFVNKIDLTGALISAYLLKNPTTGANSVVASSSGSMPISGISVSYPGSNQTNTADNSAVGAVSTTSPKTTTLSTGLDNCWTILAARNKTTGTTSAGTGSSLLLDAGGFQLYDSNASQGTLGSKSMAVTFTGGNNVGTLMVSFGPTQANVVSDSTALSDAITNFVAIVSSVSETLGLTDLLRTLFGWPNSTKDTSTWTNQNKT